MVEGGGGPSRPTVRKVYAGRDKMGKWKKCLPEDKGGQGLGPVAKTLAASIEPLRKAIENEGGVGKGG